MAETLVKELIEEAQGRRLARRLAVRELRPRERDLEQVFFDLIEKGTADVA